MDCDAGGSQTARCVHGQRDGPGVSHPEIHPHVPAALRSDGAPLPVPARAADP